MQGPIDRDEEEDLSIKGFGMKDGILDLKILEGFMDHSANRVNIHLSAKYDNHTISRNRDKAIRRHTHTIPLSLNLPAEL